VEERKWHSGGGAGIEAHGRGGTDQFRTYGRPRRSQEGWRTKVIPLYWRAKVDVEDLQIEIKLVGVTNMVKLEGWTTVEPNDWRVQVESVVLTRR